MFTGARISPAQLLEQINAVTAADIQCVPPEQAFMCCKVVTPFSRRVALGLVKSKVALAAVGDVSYVPSYDAVAELFK
jgi:hypothetical protein